MLWGINLKSSFIIGDNIRIRLRKMYRKFIEGYLWDII